jgi:hypothetical protein
VAIDSEDKRRSVHGYLGPFAVIAPRPDGALDEADRKHVAGIYRGQLISLAVFSSLAPAGVSILFLVADVNGRVLTEINPEIQRVSWRWNAAGGVSFVMAATDPKLREEYFVDGNRVLLQFDNGLPDWGGVLTGARDWNGSSVAFGAVSGEWILSTRRTARARYFTEAQVGTILTQILQEAEAYYPTGLRPGNIWQGGSAHSPEYHRASLYDVVADDLVGNMSAGAFDVTPSLESGRILFSVNLYQRKGVDRPGVALVENQNITGIRYREIDEAINTWHMAGEGDGWEDDSRVYATALNSESVTRHGMREGSEVLSGVTEQSALDAIAAKRLSETAWPTRVLGLTVRDGPPGRYRDYGIGDAVTCRLHSFGFGGVDGLFEVRAREFFPDSGTTDLVLLEVVS